MNAYPNLLFKFLSKISFTNNQYVDLFIIIFGKHIILIWIVTISETKKAKDINYKKSLSKLFPTLAIKLQWLFFWL